MTSAGSVAMGQWEPRVEIEATGEEILVLAGDGADAIIGITARKREVTQAGQRDRREEPALSEAAVELLDISAEERAAVVRAEPEDAFTIVFHVDYLDRGGAVRTSVQPAYFLCRRQDAARSCDRVALTDFWLATGQARLVEDVDGRLLLDRPLLRMDVAAEGGAQ